MDIELGKEKEECLDVPQITLKNISKLKIERKITELPSNIKNEVDIPPFKTSATVFFTSDRLDDTISIGEIEETIDVPQFKLNTKKLLDTDQLKDNPSEKIEYVHQIQIPQINVLLSGDIEAYSIFIDETPKFVLIDLKKKQKV